MKHGPGPGRLPPPPLLLQVFVDVAVVDVAVAAAAAVVVGLLRVAEDEVQAVKLVEERPEEREREREIVSIQHSSIVLSLTFKGCAGKP
jgi:hypothetical protein